MAHAWTVRQRGSPVARGGDSGYVSLSRSSGSTERKTAPTGRCARLIRAFPIQWRSDRTRGRFMARLMTARLGAQYSTSGSQCFAVRWNAARDPKRAAGVMARHPGRWLEFAKRATTVAAPATANAIFRPVGPRPHHLPMRANDVRAAFKPAWAAERRCYRAIAPRGNSRLSARKRDVSRALIEQRFRSADECGRSAASQTISWRAGYRGRIDWPYLTKDFGLGPSPQ